VKHCTQCGHVLGLGRFCTNCGHPVAARHHDPLSDPIEPAHLEPDTLEPDALEPDTLEPDDRTPAQDDVAADWRTDTAERTVKPAVATAVDLPSTPDPSPRVPPAATEPPPPPRFPLFADEVVEAGPAPVDPPPVPAPGALLPWEQEDAEEDWEEDDWDEEWEGAGRSRTVKIAGALVVLTVLVVGAWFLGQVIGGDDGGADDPTATDSSSAGSAPGSVDHTAEASAKAPRTAPPNEDVDGNPTSYDASNMLDGVPETAWRTAGDGSGLKLVFTFPAKTRITQVGLINGYAKEATDGSGKKLDWYEGHRRIESVTWNFGVGPVVRQNLEDDRAVQTVDLEPVEVRKIVLKIVSVTAPGDGPAARDFTAISDVLLAG
jgi:hypothetical protein